MTSIERERARAQIEMIDYVLNTFCKEELSGEARNHLRALRFKISLKFEHDSDTESTE